MSHRREQIRAQLLADMASRQLRPGDQIRIDHCARRIRLSAIPVREELWRLVGEGLLVARPGMGFFVPRLHAEDLAQLYRARRLIVVASLDRLALPLGPQADIHVGPPESSWLWRLCDALVRRTQDHAMDDLWHRTGLRLAPYSLGESEIRVVEQANIVDALGGLERSMVRKALVALLRRRENEAAATVRRVERANPPNID